MFCTNCGTEIPQGALNCPSCGRQLFGATGPEKPAETAETLPVEPVAEPEAVSAEPTAAPAEPEAEAAPAA